MISFFWFLILFSFVVLVHEGGHFLAARWSGVKVYQFSVGFGPKILSKKVNDTLFSIGIIPFGGFVRLAGLDDDENNKPQIGESYEDKRIWQKILIIVSGVLFNLISSVVLISMIYMLFGVPSGIDNKIASVVKGTPAAKVGILAGDEIIKLDGQKVENVEAMVEKIHMSKGQTLKFEIKRNAEILSFDVIPKFDNEKKMAFAGFVLASKGIERYNPIRAFYYGFLETVLMTKQIFVGVGLLVTGKVPVSQLAGPIGIVKISGQVATYGVAAYLKFMAFFSINLAVLNILPFPALDGGRLFFLIAEGVFGRRIFSKKLEEKIHIIGFALLISLLIWVSYLDIIRK